jgi:hypothetical protein
MAHEELVSDFFEALTASRDSVDELVSEDFRYEDFRYKGGSPQAVRGHFLRQFAGKDLKKPKIPETVGQTLLA